MTPAEILEKCQQAGVTVSVSGDDIKVKGKQHAIEEVAPLLRLHKSQVIGFLVGKAADDLIAELIEVDGISAVDAAQIAMASVNIRPAQEWLAMIAELDQLIFQYCEKFKLDEAARGRIMQIRYRQSLVSIPQTLEWFRDELASSAKEGL